MRTVFFFAVLFCLNASVAFAAGGDSWMQSPFDSGSEMKKASEKERPEPKVKRDRFLIDKRDDEKYEIVIIGKKAWMAENLRFRTPESECVDHDERRCSEGGRYYTWADAMKVPPKCNISECKLLAMPHIRGICPEGWHIPSDSEWKDLVLYVRGKAGHNAARVLKSTYGWMIERGTNESHFNVYPAGFRFQTGNFLDHGITAKFWSSTQLDVVSARSWMLKDKLVTMIPESDYKSNELNVRCTADE